MKHAETPSLHTISTGSNLAAQLGAQNSNDHWQLQLDRFECRCEAGALIRVFLKQNLSVYYTAGFSIVW